MSQKTKSAKKQFPSLTACYDALKQVLAQTDVEVVKDYSGARTAKGQKIIMGLRDIELLLDVDGQKCEVTISIRGFGALGGYDGYVPADSLPVGKANEIWGPNQP